ncbi:glyoxalase superfamily protein [Mesorhizobium sp. AaZ16]|uniref:glyoxalase superfamily protein n=1 Tax=Mesorhizobium sp. AaZ16 TaxID=3402289 RepID=UPI00374FA4F6
MPTLGAVIPILRIFDIDKAREFYVGFLSFEVQWEHRFDENSPLYMEVVRDGCALHLSEHYGDASPGSAVRIRVEDITGLHRELRARDYRFAKPGLEEMPWKTREVSITDLFGNRLHFFEEMADYRRRPKPVEDSTVRAFHTRAAACTV